MFAEAGVSFQWFQHQGFLVPCVWRSRKEKENSSMVFSMYYTGKGMSLWWTSYCVLWDWSLFILCKTIPTTDKITPEFPWVWQLIYCQTSITSHRIPVCPCCLTNHSPSNILWKGGIKAFLSHTKVLCGTALPWLLYKFTGNPLSVWRRRRNEELEPPGDTGLDIPIKKSPGAFSMFHQNIQPAAAWSSSCSVLWFYLEDLGTTEVKQKRKNTAVSDLPPGIKKTQRTILGSESSGSLGKANLQVLQF